MPDIRHSIRIAASVASPKAPRGIRPVNPARALVAEADGFRQWWAEDVQTEADGRVSLGFFSRATLYHLRLQQNDASRVAWRCETGEEWQGTDLVFAFCAEGSEFVLDFTHANWREMTPYFISCNATWGALMFRLKSAVEGRQPGPLFRKGSLDY